MAATGLNQVFDQSQIADAINRQKIGSQRQRREMMRLGTTDPSAFALQNQPSLQQAQQPSEFLGAGRKPLPPGSDRSLLQAAGLGLQDTSSEGTVYYGDQDPLKFSWGGRDADDIDLGGGKYNIMSGGQSVGTGYKSVQDAIRELRLEKSSVNPTKFWKSVDSLPESVYDLPTWANPMGHYSLDQKILNPQKMSAAGYRQNVNYVQPEYYWGSQPQQPQYEQLIDGFSFNNKNYNTQAEAEAARQAAANANISNNATKDWEILGQLLNYGTTTGTFNDRAIGGNNIADPISGLNTLFGTKPIMYDGKLHSYYGDLNINPITDKWANQWSSSSKSGGLFNKKVTTNWGWDQGNLGMGRQLVNPDWYSKNAIVRDGKFTLTPEAAKNAPGWLNSDYFNRDQGSGSSTQKLGFLGSVFNFLDPILDKVDPIHNKVQEWTTGSKDTMGQMPYFQTIMPMIMNGFFAGSGSALTAIDQASLGNTKGAIGNAALAYLGASGGFDTGLGNIANAAATGATSGAINSWSRGGDLADMFKAAAIGGLSGGVGSGVGQATQGLNPTLQGFLSEAAKGAVSNLAQPKKILESALISGVGGGLGGMFTSANATPKERQSNITTGKNVSNLAAKLFKDRIK